MKNAALFKGALVAPTSLTFGIESGRGAGSRKGWDEDSPGRKEELIVVAAVGVVCTIRFGGRVGHREYGAVIFPF